ncbi:NfeD family protein [Comamonas humi]
MAESTLWWIASGVAVGAELLTGTLYLLMVAIGLAAAAVAAHLGLSAPVQMLVAAVVGSATVVLCYLRQKRQERRRGGQRSAQTDPDLHLDIGEQLHIAEWNADGTAQVRYRGAQWTAVLRHGADRTGTTYRVAELEGSRLLVEPVSE